MGKTAKLYTTMERTKRLLNDGSVPPFMEAQIEAAAILDAKFTARTARGKIAGGVVVQDPDRGLRCPVKKCGLWFHDLDRHIKSKHSSIGGGGAIRNMLGLPEGVKLVSDKLRAQRSATAKRNIAAGKFKPGCGTLFVKGHKPNASKISETKNSTMWRNWWNTCNAQIPKRLWIIRDTLRRPPTYTEAESMDGGLAQAAEEFYGSFNNALLAAGIGINQKKGWSVDDVCEAFSAWYAVHGTLPTVREMRDPYKIPKLPDMTTVIKVLGAKGWPHAMQMVASLLGKHGGRYGLPQRKAG